MLEFSVPERMKASVERILVCWNQALLTESFAVDSLEYATLLLNSFAARLAALARINIFIKECHRQGRICVAILSFVGALTVVAHVARINLTSETNRVNLALRAAWLF